jgi:serine/threonine protein kinase
VVHFIFKQYYLDLLTKHSHQLYTMSPEVMFADYAGSQSDMWSIGVMTYLLLSGEKPFLGKTPYVRAIMRSFSTR